MANNLGSMLTTNQQGLLKRAKKAAGIGVLALATVFTPGLTQKVDGAEMADELCLNKQYLNNPANIVKPGNPSANKAQIYVSCIEHGTIGHVEANNGTAISVSPRKLSSQAYIAIIKEIRMSPTGKKSIDPLAQRVGISEKPDKAIIFTPEDGKKYAAFIFPSGKYTVQTPTGPKPFNVYNDIRKEEIKFRNLGLPPHSWYQYGNIPVEYIEFPGNPPRPSRDGAIKLIKPWIAELNRAMTLPDFVDPVTGNTKKKFQPTSKLVFPKPVEQHKQYVTFFGFTDQNTYWRSTFDLSGQQDFSGRRGGRGTVVFYKDDESVKYVFQAEMFGILSNVDDVGPFNAATFMFGLAGPTRPIRYAMLKYDLWD